MAETATVAQVESYVEQAAPQVSVLAGTYRRRAIQFGLTKEDLRRVRQNFDPSGHCARPDMTRLESIGNGKMP
jgi:hypothetical protein